MTKQSKNFSSLFGPDQILYNTGAEKFSHIIHCLLECIANSKQLFDIEEVYQLVLAREGCDVSFIQAGVAAVHVRVKGLKQLHIAFAISREGFVCNHEELELQCFKRDSGPLNVVVLIMAPIDDMAGQLRAVTALKSICKHDGFVEHLMDVKNAEDVWSAFARKDEQLPEYVEAQHIMRTEFSSLHVSDHLSAAIDLFCKEDDIGEYPVVDDDGDLVGIVSEAELIRLCLPEYITWMEELSTVLNFEPLAQISQHEASIPVMEIMEFAEQYATVDKTTPAIQVAKVMMRRNVRQVFVLQEQQLLGIISIQDLIRKVLRS